MSIYKEISLYSKRLPKKLEVFLLKSPKCIISCNINFVVILHFYELFIFRTNLLFIKIRILFHFFVFKKVSCKINPT